jgi:GTPase involved in cell partitioning and DNA repair
MTNTWSLENQQYLMSQVKLVREQLEKYNQSLLNNQELVASNYAEEMERLKQSTEIMIAPPAIDTLVNTLGAVFI